MIGLHFSSQQPLLPKIARHSTTQPADKKHGGETFDLLTITLKPDANNLMCQGIPQT